MMVRRTLFVMLAAVLPMLGVLSAKPAVADAVITSSFDKEVAHPGDTVTLNVTFTNPETVDVTFTFLTVNTAWPTIYSHTKWSQTSCTGEITTCEHYTVPIAPGATRTATLTFDIAPDSPCGDNTVLQFFFYNYRESAAGAFDLLAWSPDVTILC
jgi:hypothetical protein